MVADTKALQIYSREDAFIRTDAIALTFQILLHCRILGI